MSQFTLYRNEDPSSNQLYPYFVDIQNTLLGDLNTRVVIPFTPLNALGSVEAKKLCPVFEIEGDRFALLTHQITSVPRSILKNEIASLDGQRYEILAAIDMLISGI